MTNVPFAHVAGVPIEETLAFFGPLLFVGFGVAWANLRSRLRPVRSRVNPGGRPRRTRAQAGRSEIGGGRWL